MTDEQTPIRFTVKSGDPEAARQAALHSGAWEGLAVETSPDHPLSGMAGVGAPTALNAEPAEGSVEEAILRLRRASLAETGLDPDDGWR